MHTSWQHRSNVLGQQMEVSGQLHALATLLPERHPGAHNRRLGGSHNQSGHLGEAQNFLPLLGN